MSERNASEADKVHKSSRDWVRRFGYAMRGMAVAVWRESNFWVYAACTIAAMAVGAYVGFSAERWCLVALSTATVVTAEMFNTSIEHLARAITLETHPEIRDALDVASAAVLAAATGSAIVGFLIVIIPLVERLW